MRRWNGWGEEEIHSTRSEAMLAYLREHVGDGRPVDDAARAEVEAQAPASRMRAHPHLEIATDPATRLLYARGQSFPDWIDMRYGTVSSFPDGVARPGNADEVRALLDHAAGAGLVVIPYGGGTSVVGHLTPETGKGPDGPPVLTIDLRGLSRLRLLERSARLATIGAGATGPMVEQQLARHGMTLGHFPQSFEYSTLGGWIATRSSGQQSLRYGRIEDLFAGGRMETPRGTLEIPAFPASGAGTDLRAMVLGSEGRAGIITEATVRVTPRAEAEQFHGVFMPDWRAGATAVRELAQSGLPLSMLRLSNATETRTHQVMANKPDLIRWLNRFLRMRGLGYERCMLMFGATGTKREVRRLRREATALLRAHGGVVIGQRIGKTWAHKRFRSAYLRNTLWDAGYGIDTAETAVIWPRTDEMMHAIEDAARGALDSDGERSLVFTHLSHVYPQGSSVYSTFLFRLADTAEATLARWQKLKRAVSEAIVRVGGTISHQHGVGVDHRRYVVAEKGEAGIDAIRAMARHFDPVRMMNPGKLIP